MFPKARVRYIDTDRASIEALRAQGYDGTRADARTYQTSTPPDLAIILNMPSEAGEAAIRNTKAQVVLANYMDMAMGYGLGGMGSVCDELADQQGLGKDYAIVGIIRYPHTSARYTAITPVKIGSEGFPVWVRKQGYDLGDLFLFHRDPTNTAPRPGPTV